MQNASRQPPAASRVASLLAGSRRGCAGIHHLWSCLAPLILGGAVFFLGPRLLQGGVDDWLPDIIVREADLHDHDIRTSIAPGRKHLRLSNGTPNIGLGKLYLFGVLPGNPDGTQDVLQRVFRSDGSFYDRRAGLFVYHAQHNHIHIEDWCRYRLRQALPGDGVGEVVAEGDKVSFCILDLGVFDNRLPNFQSRPEFVSCGTTLQGLSVGWLDIYSKDLPGQNIDITDVPDGYYWLESEADPDNHILESNDENNIARIKITLGNPPSAPDFYEPNDNPEATDDRPAGGPNSPNFGPCNPKRVVRDLNIHASRNDDYFKFYMNDIGTDRNFVRIDFQNNQGNLELGLLDANRAEVAVSTGDLDLEVVPLEGLAEGWYYARVFGRNGALSQEYTITVVPPRNGFPSVTVLTPAEGNVNLIHGTELFEVTWEYSDPEMDKTWVTVYFNAQPYLDGNEILLPTTLNTDAELGFATVNTAEVHPGTYWVYCSITDGGSTTGSWSEGTVTIIEIEEECRAAPGSAGDCNGNTVVDRCELELGLSPDCNLNGVPDTCDIGGGASRDRDQNGIPDDCERPIFHRGDTNSDGEVDISDGSFLFSFLFLGGASPGCLETVDINNDKEMNVSDGVSVLNYLFLGGPPPAEPGPPPSDCGTDPDPLDSDGDFGCERYDRC